MTVTMNAAELLNLEGRPFTMLATSPEGETIVIQSGISFTIDRFTAKMPREFHVKRASLLDDLGMQIMWTQLDSVVKKGDFIQILVEVSLDSNVDRIDAASEPCPTPISDERLARESL